MPERTSHLATNQVYMAHFAVTDAANNEYFCFERRSRGAGGLAGATGDPIYKVWLEDWSATEVEPGVMHLHCPFNLRFYRDRTADRTIPQPATDTLHRYCKEIAASAKKVLESGNATYYYSLVGLKTTGEVTVNGEDSNYQRDQLDGS